jgi:hypothetical protein
MKLAHLLWSDPFTKDGHDAMVADIQAAAADPSVVMWFGPDEIDLNSNWPMAAGIKRIVRGESDDTAALLHDYPPGATAYLPANEPAADPQRLPFAAAMAFTRGLSAGPRFYDAQMPSTYPFGDATSAANESDMGTWRVGAYAANKPLVPVLQMIGIEEMGLSQPTAGQVRAEIASSIANGAFGAFYYTLVSDKPMMAGRQGYFAADDRQAWAAFKEMHALEDALVPVIYGAASTKAHVGEGEKLEWRTWSRGDHRVTIVVNPRATKTSVDLVNVVMLGEGEQLRSWGDCTPVDTTLKLGPYEVAVVETAPISESSSQTAQH